MTNNQKEDLSNPKIFGMLIVVAIASMLVIAAVPSQNAMATNIITDIDVDEAAEAGNATMVGRDMNQTTNPEIPGTNSTS
ncbi:MAG: hypothetical protein MRJ93_05280 [Nitrososphaeraceae archaeon]|nr:hypothetical protein [Nitrososphaeraceae archaeon]